LDKSQLRGFYLVKIRVLISGESMWPTFADGDEVFFESFNGQRLEIGDIVVANHPFKSNLNVVKRIAGIDHNDKIHLEGDNPDPLSSEDGHNFGPVNKEGIYALLPKDMIEEAKLGFMRGRTSKDDLATAAISALIIFIAMILIASVISALIIGSMMTLLRESQNDAADTDNLLHGRVIILDATITSVSKSGTEIDAAVILIAFEMAPGSTTMNDEKMLWSVFCPNEVNSNNDRWSNYGNLESATTVSGNGGDVDAIDSLTPGETYMVAIALYHDDDPAAKEGGCPPNEGETHTLLFAIDGSGSSSSWELRYKQNIDTGTQLI